MKELNFGKYFYNEIIHNLSKYHMFKVSERKDDKVHPTFMGDKLDVSYKVPQ